MSEGLGGLNPTVPIDLICPFGFAVEAFFVFRVDWLRHVHPLHWGLTLHLQFCQVHEILFRGSLLIKLCGIWQLVLFSRNNFLFWLSHLYVNIKGSHKNKHCYHSPDNGSIAVSLLLNICFFPLIANLRRFFKIWDILIIVFVLITFNDIIIYWLLRNDLLLICIFFLLALFSFEEGGGRLPLILNAACISCSVRLDPSL